MVLGADFATEKNFEVVFYILEGIRSDLIAEKFFGVDDRQHFVLDNFFGVVFWVVFTADKVFGVEQHFLD